ncbi:MAG: pirin family protein [Crocinitomicaceae bacterium]|tara:strand:+ start:1879 stop:2748 length:870 start_codon:yes stop_codon:yes gene_type:complete
MNNRTIKKIIPAQRVEMGGHLLDQPLPVPGIEKIDPFLLIHHWDESISLGGKQNEMGVGPHPHRGFSPVTFIFKGSLRHQDSIGNTAVISSGGTQWMHAGRGIVHSERPGIETVKNGGDQEFIQFWVNTPAKYKMEAPYYLPITNEDTPKIKKDKAEIAIVAGIYESIKGPAKTYSPQTLLRVDAEQDAKFEIPLPKAYNTLLYILDGELDINGKKASSKDMIWFENDGAFIDIKTEQKSRFIILSGEPIGEPIASYGPFVMNTQEELRQSVNDFHNGKMGALSETFEA